MVMPTCKHLTDITHCRPQELDMKMQDDVYTPLQRWHKQYKHIKVRHPRSQP